MRGESSTIEPVQFQRLASEQGREFRDLCVKSLQRAGFESVHVEEKFPDVGITLDIIANNVCGIAIAIECKGSMLGSRPGCMRTDSVLKAIGEAYLLRMSQIGSMFPPMMLMTSHVADAGAARAMLGAVAVDVIIDVLNPYNHARQLAWWAKATEQDILKRMDTFRTIEEVLHANRW